MGSICILRSELGDQWSIILIRRWIRQIGNDERNWLRPRDRWRLRGNLERFRVLVRRRSHAARRPRRPHRQRALGRRPLIGQIVPQGLFPLSAALFVRLRHRFHRHVGPGPRLSHRRLGALQLDRLDAVVRVVVRDLPLPVHNHILLRRGLPHHGHHRREVSRVAGWLREIKVH